jgi:hypothetical protein
MARPSKGSKRKQGVRSGASVTKASKSAFRTTIHSPGSAGGKKRGATRVGPPGYTPSNQWADVWKRRTSGMFARPVGSGPSRRRGY